VDQLSWDQQVFYKQFFSICVQLYPQLLECVDSKVLVWGGKQSE
jgi:hypothetical protein